MTQSILFSSGMELAPFVTSSGLLCRSWDVISSCHAGIISNVGVGLSWKVYQEPDKDLTIIAFEATPDSSNLQADLVSSSDLREKNFLHFDFLCSESNPLFSVNSTAISLFYENHQRLDQLKSEILPKKESKSEVSPTKEEISSTPLIVTGHALGGSVASLFTISLLDSIGSEKNRPLCITYGSPLIGDKKLQQAISRSSNWNSCFLHVVSHKDPLPRLFITNPTSAYMPFGTFLLCSDANSTCFENPDSDLEILLALNSIHVQNQGFHSADYRNIVENLNLTAICKDFTTRPEAMTHADSLASSISLQLQALGLTPHMQEQQNIDNNILEKIKKLEEKFISQRRISYDPTKKLNKMKGYMALLEWYKKETKDEQIGYYDSSKKANSLREFHVVEYRKQLTNYWEKMVEEAEIKPQREGAAFRDSFLYGGTNYRRMVEPLVIADYYEGGGKDYTKGRSSQFKVLEEWLMEAKTKAKNDLNKTSKQNVKAILTMDSCFWARVEEALLSCKELKVVKEKEEVLKKLFEFEEYVYGLLKNYEVSPEIFLAQSSYMRWWNEYMAIKGPTHDSKLANFMKDASNLGQYTSGKYDFP